MEGKFVKEIRENNLKITKNSIVYYWWFKESILPDLLNENGLLFDELKLKVREIKKEKYVLLYIGKGKNGQGRLVDYHILDKGSFHRLKTVLNGRLSSLRQTLCGLLNLQMTAAKKQINDFMDENCFVEYKEVENIHLDKIEQKIIVENYLPLNYQHQSHNFPREYRRQLTYLKHNVKN
jgi:hypothetical protein